MAKTILMISPSGTSVYTKDGFSWPAFFFGPIWALVKKAWRDFFVLFAAFATLIFVDEVFVKPSKNLLLLLLMLAVYVTFMIVCGRNGNEWLRKSLERKGYTRSTE
jgi:Protein of unknown function (DUF2628)